MKLLIQGLFLGIFLFSCTSKQKNAKKSKTKPYRIGKVFSIENNDNIVNQQLNEYSESWEVPFNFYWQGKDLKFSKKSIYKAFCGRSRSANCPDTTCEFNLDGKKIKGIQEAIVLEGRPKDLLILRGNSSGCGGSSYSVSVVDSEKKVLCSLNRSVGWEEDDEKADKCLFSIYENPNKYIKWTSENECLFPSCLF